MYFTKKISYLVSIKTLTSKKAIYKLNTLRLKYLPISMHINEGVMQKTSAILLDYCYIYLIYN